MLVRGMDDAVKRRYGDDAYTAFEPFWRDLDVPAPFSWIPHEHVIMALLRVGQCAGADTRHPQAILRDVAAFWAHDVVLKSALVQMTFQASNGSLADFLMIQYRGLDYWQNFGLCTPHRQSARHYKVHYRDVAAALDAPLTEAIFQSFLDLFKTPGEVHTDIHDPRSFSVHMRFG